MGKFAIKSAGIVMMLSSSPPANLQSPFILNPKTPRPLIHVLRLLVTPLGIHLVVRAVAKTKARIKVGGECGVNAGLELIALFQIAISSIQPKPALPKLKPRPA